MNVGYYICPSCERKTEEMQIGAERYTPSETDLRKRPDMEMIGSEILLCPCGRQLTWFQVREVAEWVN